MAVATNDNSRSYQGNGGTTAFSFPIYFLNADDLRVKKLQTNGTEVALSLNSDYTVTGAGNPGGGTVTTTVPPAAGETLAILRDPPLTQLTVYGEGDDFPAKSHERALDKLTMIAQRLFERVSKALLLKDTAISGQSAYDIGGNRLSNVANGVATSDAVTLAQLQGVQAAAGNVPTPGVGDAGKVLGAFAAGAVGWTAIIPDDRTRRRLLLSTTRIAKVLGAAQRSLDELADGFAGVDGLNTGASALFAQDPTNKWITPLPGGIMVPAGSGSPIGNMTGGGGVAAAFDGNTNQSNAAGPNIITAAGTVGKDWGVGVTRTITRVVVYGPNNNSILAGNATTFRLQGSQDLSGWTDLTAAINAPASNSAVIDVTSGITATTAYRYHRINIVGNGTNTVSVAEVQFYEGVNNLTLVSAAQPADAGPTSARVLLDIEPIDVVTLNADLTAEISRDGGATFTLGTLSQVATIGARRVVETAPIGLTGQPSGTSVVARVKTNNNKNLRLHAQSTSWS